MPNLEPKILQTEIVESDEALNKLSKTGRRIFEIAKQMNIIDEIDPEEVGSIYERTNIRDMKYFLQIVMYVKYKFDYKLPKEEAFRRAFPDRSFYEPKNDEYDPNKKIGSPLPDKEIIKKANRLESSPAYKKLVSVLGTSLYITYAFDRIKVLDLALDKIHDPSVSDRNRIEYMKVFLQETRKPEDLDININATVNNQQINITTIENKMEDIAKKLSGLSADSITKLISGDKDDN